RAVGTTNGYNGSCERDHYDLLVDYKDKSLPWGTRVSLHRGISGWVNDSDSPQGGSTFEWWWTQDHEAQATDRWTWRATDTLTRSIELSDGQINETFDFVIHIQYPDGSDAWDNGGSAYGFYQVNLNNVVSNCSGTASFKSQSIERVTK